MGGLKGLWSRSERPRARREDARLVATEHLHALRRLPYAALRRRAALPEQVEHLEDVSGAPLVRRTSLTCFTRGGQEELRLLVRVDTGSFLGRLNPLAEDLLIVSPGGETTGEDAMASEGHDPRRYGLPGEGLRG